jgi:hypothetical protein
MKGAQIYGSAALMGTDAQTSVHARGNTAEQEQDLTPCVNLLPHSTLWQRACATSRLQGGGRVSKTHDRDAIAPASQASNSRHVTPGEIAVSKALKQLRNFGPISPQVKCLSNSKRFRAEAWVITRTVYLCPKNVPSPSRFRWQKRAVFPVKL